MPAEIVRAEMAEQPAALDALVARWDDLVAQVAAACPRPLRGVALVARGSSDFVAVHARYLIELATGLPVVMLAPSLWTRHDLDRDLDGWLVVALSQSGQTPEVVTVAERTRAAGAAVVAITNDAASDLAAVAGVHLALGTTPERAVPATKTVTTQLLVVAAVAAACAGDAAAALLGGAGQRARLGADVAVVLGDTAGVLTAVERCAAATDVVQIGRTLTYAAALEGALKMKETCGLPVEGFSSADFLHGPAAVAGPGAVVVAYSWPGPTAADVADAVATVTGRGAVAVTVGPDAAWSGAGGSGAGGSGAGGSGAAGPQQLRITTPAGTPPGLAAVPLVVRGQQLAIALAVHLGRDPDAPEGLSKVTETT